jgi:hypothetical protein
MLAELADDIDQMPHRAAHPIQLRDDQGVAAAQLLAAAVPLRAPGQLPRGLIDVDAFAPDCGQGVELAVGVLLAGGHPRVPDPHAVIVSETSDNPWRLAQFRTRVSDNHIRACRLVDRLAVVDVRLRPKTDTLTLGDGPHGLPQVEHCHPVDPTHGDTRVGPLRAANASSCR